MGIRTQSDCVQSHANNDQLDLEEGEDKKEYWNRKKLRWARGYKLNWELSPSTLPSFDSYSE